MEFTVSEEDRSRLYSWLCEQTDEPLAEYLMSCLSAASSSDLATKDDLAVALSNYPTKDDLKNELAVALSNYPTKDYVDARFDRLIDLREADRREHAAQREADRQESRHQFRWTIGTVIALMTVFSALVLGIG